MERGRAPHRLAAGLPTRLRSATDSAISAGHFDFRRTTPPRKVCVASSFFCLDGRRPLALIRDRSHREFLTMMRFRMLMASVFTCLLSLFLVSIASGQTAPHKPLPTEPLEKYNMPPAYLFRMETSPRMISQYGPFTSFQVNVDASGNNILGDAANEPSIAVDPTNLSRMAIGRRRFNSARSDLRRAGSGPSTHGRTTGT